MSNSNGARSVGARALALFAAFFGVALVGTTVAMMAGDARPGLAAAASFGAVISAAMLISWGAEAAQFFISQGFAVALIALLQVLPEFMVEAVIAWRGEIRNMFANATGSNRLLIGLGWPLIYFTADISNRLRKGVGVGDVRLRRQNILEILSLVVASSYYLKLLITGLLTPFDGLILGAMYVGYMAMLARLPEEDPEEKDDLLAPPRAIVEMPSRRTRNISLAAIFLVGGGVMVLVAEPFVEALKHVAVGVGVSEFVFIQWMAPFLSEFPEKVTAFYWSRTVRLAPMALLNMISSTVSQFTLLVGMIPIVYWVSAAMGNIQSPQLGLFGLPVVPMVDGVHDLRPDVFLSWAMTLLGCAMLAKLRFSQRDAALLFGIWLLQFLSGPISSATGVANSVLLMGIGGVCVALAILHLATSWKEIAVRDALRETLGLIGRAKVA